jgi:hypothetical protein
LKNIEYFEKLYIFCAINALKKHIKVCHIKIERQNHSFVLQIVPSTQPVTETKIWLNSQNPSLMEHHESSEVVHFGQAWPLKWASVVLMTVK